MIRFVWLSHLKNRDNAAARSLMLTRSLYFTLCGICTRTGPCRQTFRRKPRTRLVSTVESPEFAYCVQMYCSRF